MAGLNDVFDIAKSRVKAVLPEFPFGKSRARSDDTVALIEPGEVHTNDVGDKSAEQIMMEDVKRFQGNAGMLELMESYQDNAEEWVEARSDFIQESGSVQPSTGEMYATPRAVTESPTSNLHSEEMIAKSSDSAEESMYFDPTAISNIPLNPPPPLPEITNEQFDPNDLPLPPEDLTSDLTDQSTSKSQDAVHIASRNIPSDPESDHLSPDAQYVKNAQTEDWGFDDIISGMNDLSQEIQGDIASNNIESAAQDRSSTIAVQESDPEPQRDESEAPSIDDVFLASGTQNEDDLYAEAQQPSDDLVAAETDESIYESVPSFSGNLRSRYATSVEGSSKLDQSSLDDHQSMQNVPPEMTTESVAHRTSVNFKQKMTNSLPVLLAGDAAAAVSNGVSRLTAGIGRAINRGVSSVQNRSTKSIDVKRDGFELSEPMLKDEVPELNPDASVQDDFLHGADIPAKSSDDDSVSSDSISAEANAHDPSYVMSQRERYDTLRRTSVSEEGYAFVNSRDSAEYAKLRNNDMSEDSINAPNVATEEYMVMHSYAPTQQELEEISRTESSIEDRLGRSVRSINELAALSRQHNIMTIPTPFLGVKSNIIGVEQRVDQNENVSCSPIMLDNHDEAKVSLESLGTKSSSGKLRNVLKFRDIDGSVRKLDRKDLVVLHTEGRTRTLMNQDTGQVFTIVKGRFEGITQGTRNEIVSKNYASERGIFTRDGSGSTCYQSNISRGPEHITEINVTDVKKMNSFDLHKSQIITYTASNGEMLVEKVWLDNSRITGKVNIRVEKSSSAVIKSEDRCIGFKGKGHRNPIYDDQYQNTFRFDHKTMSVDVKNPDGTWISMPSNAYSVKINNGKLEIGAQEPSFEDGMLRIQNDTKKTTTFTMMLGKKETAVVESKGFSSRRGIVDVIRGDDFVEAQVLRIVPFPANVVEMQTSGMKSSVAMDRRVDKSHVISGNKNASVGNEKSTAIDLGAQYNAEQGMWIHTNINPNVSGKNGITKVKTEIKTKSQDAQQGTKVVSVKRGDLWIEENSIPVCRSRIGKWRNDRNHTGSRRDGDNNIPAAAQSQLALHDHVTDLTSKEFQFHEHRSRKSDAHEVAAYASTDLMIFPDNVAHNRAMNAKDAKSTLQDREYHVRSSVDARSSAVDSISGSIGSVAGGAGCAKGSKPQSTHIGSHKADQGIAPVTVA